MALDGTYTGLKASIAQWLHRTDLTSIIPDLIVLAEARMARDLRLRKMVTSTVINTTANTQAITLPVDYLELENLSVLDGTIQRNLVYVNIEHLDSKYPSGSWNGVPAVYTLEADTVLFGPTPDGVYPISMLYYASLPALSVTPTNWLLSTHPEVYLFAALAEAGDWMQDNDNLGKWEGKYKSSVNLLQTADDESMFSGSALRVRRI